MTTLASKSKPEIELQYVYRPFTETESSLILAVDWDIPTKFAVQIDFQLLKHMPSLNLNPDVDFRIYGSHLEYSIWRHNSAAVRPYTTKFARQMQNNMPMTTYRENTKPEVEFECGGRPFCRHRHVILHPPANRRSNRTIGGGVMTSYTFSHSIWVMLDHTWSAIVCLRLILKFGLDLIYRFGDIAIIFNFAV